MRISFSIGSGSVVITGNTDHYSPMLASLFDAWNREPDDSEQHDSCQVTIHKEGDICRIQISGQDILEVSPESLVSAVELIITNVARDILKSHLQLHAATLDLNGAGFMFAGPHGSGKTTLTLTALSRGCKVLSDEVTVLVDTNRAIGFPRPFRLRSGTLAIKPSLIPKKLPQLSTPDGIMHLPFSMPERGLYKDETRISHIFFLNRKPGPVTLEPLTERDVFERLLPQGFNTYLRPDEFIDRQLGLVHRTESYEISYEDHRAATDAVIALVRGDG